MKRFRIWSLLLAAVLGCACTACASRYDGYIDKQNRDINLAWKQPEHWEKVEHDQVTTGIAYRYFDYENNRKLEAFVIDITHDDVNEDDVTIGSMEEELEYTDTYSRNYKVYKEIIPRKVEVINDIVVGMSGNMYRDDGKDMYLYQTFFYSGNYSLIMTYISWEKENRDVFDSIVKSVKHIQ